MARRRMKAHRNAGAKQFYIKVYGKKRGPYPLEEVAGFIVNNYKLLKDQIKVAQLPLGDAKASEVDDDLFGAWTEFNFVNDMVRSMRDEDIGDTEKMFYAKAKEIEAQGFDLPNLIQFIARVQPLLPSNDTIQVAIAVTPNTVPAEGKYKSWRTYTQLRQMVEAYAKRHPLGLALGGRERSRDPEAAFSRGLFYMGPPIAKTELEGAEAMFDAIDRLERKLGRERLSAPAVRSVNRALDILDAMVSAIGSKISPRRISNMAFQWGQAVEDMANHNVPSRALHAMQNLAKKAVKDIVKEEIVQEN